MCGRRKRADEGRDGGGEESIFWRVWRARVRRRGIAGGGGADDCICFSVFVYLVGGRGGESCSLGVFFGEG